MELITWLFKLFLDIYFMISEFFIEIVSYFVPPEYMDQARIGVMLLIAFIIYRQFRLGKLIGAIISFIIFLFIVSTFFSKASALGLF